MVDSVPTVRSRWILVSLSQVDDTIGTSAAHSQMASVMTLMFWNIARKKKTVAVISRISSKLKVASCLRYFELCMCRTILRTLQIGLRTQFDNSYEYPAVRVRTDKLRCCLYYPTV